MTDTVRDLLERADHAYAEDDLCAARDCYRQIVEASPGHELANRALGEIARALADQFTEETVVSLAVSLRELVKADLLPREALIISRLAAGPLSVRQLTERCRLVPVDLHEILYRCVADRVVSARRP